MKNSKFIGVSVLIIALAIGYYFIFSLPAKNAREELLKNQLACSEAEKKVFVDFVALGNDRKFSYSINHYNQKLNKCMVEIFTSFSSTQSSSVTTTVIDAIENKTLIWGQISSGSIKGSVFFDYLKNPGGDFITKDQFEKIENQYMQE